MPSTFTLNQLYGGAIVALLPSGYLDTSEIRQVPDNQEVRLSPSSLTSVIFDIVERAEPPSHSCRTDAEALRYHYDDVVSTQPERSKETALPDTAEETRVLEPPKLVLMPKLGHKYPVWTMLATQTPKDPAPANDGEKSRAEFTAMFVTLIRLETAKTDVIVTVTVPHVLGEEGYTTHEDVDLDVGKETPLMVEGREILEQILHSFEIVEWGLFSPS
ncbi:MAG: multicopy suppressor of ts gsp1 [Chrysothrix sp. TS-e1954]|nr:MAG: multicopy suppressor of ts gsp1 [Chrysothrix sp. TS-e1954]